MAPYLNGTVLVAGGAGFVGSTLLRELQGKCERIVCLDNYAFGVEDNIRDLPDNVIKVRADVRDAWQLSRIFSTYAVRYVINCVGDTYVPSAYHNPKRFFEINLDGAYNLLKACTEHQVLRMVHVSSTEVYGPMQSDLISECHPLNPVNTYAVSKLAADRLCYTFYLEHSCPVVIARIFNCYGPRETHPYIVPEIIKQLQQGNTVHLGNTSAERDFTYVHDTARALILLMSAHGLEGECVNVGSGVAVRIDELVHRIGNIMGVAHPQIALDPNRLRVHDVQCFRCDNRKLVGKTGWSSSVSLDEGLQLTVDWFRRNGCHWSWENHWAGEEQVVSSSIQENDNRRPFPGDHRLASSVML